MTEQDPRNPLESPASSDAGSTHQAAPSATPEAARAAAAAFIQSAAPAPEPAPAPAPAPSPQGQDFGSVEEAQAQTKKKRPLVAVLIGLLIAVLLLGCLGAYLFMSGAFTHNEPTTEETMRVPLSDARVISAFEEATIAAPDISQYAYVPQDDLIGPKFSDIVVNEPVDLGASSNQIVESTATATATFKNKGIEIAIPVTLPFEYSPESETWVPGDITQGEPTTTPLASASASEIVGNLNDILMAYDPTYGEAMADATVVKTTADLTIDGGTIGVDLSKNIEEVLEDKTVNELRTCSVVMTVAWSNDKGWTVSVTDAGQIDYQTNEIPNPNAANPAEVQPVDVTPENLGAVKFGDSVSVSGTLQAVENTGALADGNGYKNENVSENAEGAVQLVLKLARPIDIEINGQPYRLTTMAVATSGLADNGAGLIGRKADVKGPLEESFATSWCPAGIKAMEIHVE